MPILLSVKLNSFKHLGQWKTGNKKTRPEIIVRFQQGLTR
jgi:hypothetical protein